MTALAPLGQMMLAPGPAAGLSPTMGASSSGAALSGRQKAAVVIRTLLAEGVEFSLTDLPEALQTQLIHDMADMRAVDKDTVETILTEFISKVEAIGLSFPGGMVGTLQSLDGKLSQSTLNRLRAQAGMNVSGNPWQQIAGLSTEALLSVLQTESIEVAAVLLSKLDVSRSAELLGMVDGPRARRITYAVSLTAGITPDAVERIGLALATQLTAAPSRAFDTAPVARVGAILNSSPAATRDDVLEGLQETDKEFAEEVKRAIFTFENIPDRVDLRDIPKVLKGLDAEVLATALAAARGGRYSSVADFILGAMSQRMASQLEERFAEMGKIPAADGEEAMQAFVNEIRRLETDGEISLNADAEVTLD